MNEREYERLILTVCVPILLVIGAWLFRAGVKDEVELKVAGRGG